MGRRVQEEIDYLKDISAHNGVKAEEIAPGDIVVSQ